MEVCRQADRLNVISRRQVEGDLVERMANYNTLRIWVICRRSAVGNFFAYVWGNELGVTTSDNDQAAVNDLVSRLYQRASNSITSSTRVSALTDAINRYVAETPQLNHYIAETQLGQDITLNDNEGRSDAF